MTDYFVSIKAQPSHSNLENSQRSSQFQSSLWGWLSFYLDWITIWFLPTSILLLPLPYWCWFWRHTPINILMPNINVSRLPMSPAIGFYSDFPLICNQPESQCQSWRSDLKTMQRYSPCFLFSTSQSSLHASFSYEGPHKWMFDILFQYIIIFIISHIIYHIIIINNYILW